MKINYKKYSSKYFLDISKIVEKSNDRVLLRFFSFTDNYILCGMKHVKKIIYESIPKKDLKNITIHSRKDGELINKEEPILLIEGHYSDFGFLENVIDGILSRMSSIATNVYNIKKITDKEIIFMGDRTDLFVNQKYDGYAAYIGGIRNFVTESMIEDLKQFDDYNYVGTIPHALIQQHNGDIVKSLTSYKKYFPNNKLVALIDYHNDCISEINKIANSEIKNDIYAIRIDTSSSLIDKSLQDKKIKEYGVNDTLVKLVRKELDKNNMNDVKIIVSSNINENKIKEFNSKKTPIDIYGIGNFFLSRNVLFTGDLIKLNDKYEAKVGRNNPIEKYLNKMIKW